MLHSTVNCSIMAYTWCMGAALFATFVLLISAYKGSLLIAGFDLLHVFQILVTVCSMVFFYVIGKPDHSASPRRLEAIDWPVWVATFFSVLALALGGLYTYGLMRRKSNTSSVCSATDGSASAPAAPHIGNPAPSSPRGQPQPTSAIQHPAAPDDAVPGAADQTAEEPTEHRRQPGNEQATRLEDLLGELPPPLAPKPLGADGAEFGLVLELGGMTTDEVPLDIDSETS